jgi:hypothetical protein
LLRLIDRHVSLDFVREKQEDSCIPKLRQALDDDAPEVSFTAARILWEMGDTSGRIVPYPGFGW